MIFVIKEALLALDDMESITADWRNSVFDSVNFYDALDSEDSSGEMMFMLDTLAGISAFFMGRPKFAFRPLDGHKDFQLFSKAGRWDVVFGKVYQQNHWFSTRDTVYYAYQATSSHTQEKKFFMPAAIDLIRMYDLVDLACFQS